MTTNNNSIMPQKNVADNSFINLTPSSSTQPPYLIYCVLSAPFGLLLLLGIAVLVAANWGAKSVAFEWTQPVINSDEIHSSINSNQESSEKQVNVIDSNNGISHNDFEHNINSSESSNHEESSSIDQVKAIENVDFTTNDVITQEIIESVTHFSGYGSTYGNSDEDLPDLFSTR